MMLLPPISEAQLQALAGLIDAGVRYEAGAKKPFEEVQKAGPLRAATAAAALVGWLQQAQSMDGPKDVEREDDAA